MSLPEDKLSIPEQEHKGLLITLSNFLDKFLEIFIVSITSFMVLLVFMQVILRYVFNAGFHWSEELSRYLLVAITFIGGSYALKKNKHVSLDIIKKSLPVKVQKVLQVFIYLIILFFTYYFVISGIDLVSRFSFQLSPALRITMAVPQGALIVGGVLMGLQTLILLIKNIIEIRSSK